jgi:hypothetical protein
VDEGGVYHSTEAPFGVRFPPNSEPLNYAAGNCLGSNDEPAGPSGLLCDFASVLTSSRPATLAVGYLRDDGAGAAEVARVLEVIPKNLRLTSGSPFDVHLAGAEIARGIRVEGTKASTPVTAELRVVYRKPWLIYWFLISRRGDDLSAGAPGAETFLESFHLEDR